MKVTISLLNYNKAKYLKHCLDSILNQTHQNLEIFIVDNASTDNSHEQIKNYLNNIQHPISNIQYFHNNANIGYSKAHNQIIRHSSGKYILCLNPDIILDKDYIKNALEILQQNPTIGALTGKIYKWKFNENKKTNIIDSCGHKILKSHRVIEWGSNQKDSVQFDCIKKVFSVSGAAPIYRKSALESIKYYRNIKTTNQQKNHSQKISEYFDESFFAYKEDIDLSWRLLHQGWEIWFDPKAKCWHDRWETGTSESGAKTIKQRNKKTPFINQLSYRNHLLTLYKNEFASNFLIYFFYILYYELKKFFYILFFEPKTLKAIPELFKLCRLTKQKRNYIIKNSKLKPKDIRKYIVTHK